MKVSAFLILLVISPALFSLPVQKQLKMHKNPNAMKQEIAKQIPIGSSIKDAQRVMEANGFKCELMERSAYTEKQDDESVELHENVDFLWCDKETRAWLLCLRRWQVAIVHKDGIVSYISVAISLACP
jgi:hypothetical protein